MRESMSYELGIMMFNAFRCEVPKKYDMVGNFKYLYLSVTDLIDPRFMQRGYTEEAKNHINKSEEELNKMFLNDLKSL